MAPLQSKLDNDVQTAVERLLYDGVGANVADLFTALSRSNSSLKRRPKKTLEACIERVLGVLNIEDELDSEAAIDDLVPDSKDIEQTMNKSLRANLAAPRSPLAAPMGDDTGLSAKRKANGESLPKRQKRNEEKISITPPHGISLEDLGGMDNVIKEMNDLIIMPLYDLEHAEKKGKSSSNGILLHGPPGCGKTMLARAYAATVDVPFVEILGPSIVSGMSGESEKGIRDRFEEAKKNAPCILFIDEIDAIAPKRDSSQSQMEKRIVAQLLVSMDDIKQDPSKPVIVIAATNRPDSIDPALRRGGRFGTEININVPNESVRQRILETQTRRVDLAPDVDFVKLGKMTAGFVGADLQDLVGKAEARQMHRYTQALEQQATELRLDARSSENASEAVKAAHRLVARMKRQDLPRPLGFEQMHVGMQDFLDVLPRIIPSSKREGFSTVPEVSWKDIGALQTVREELISAIIDPIEKPELCEALGRDNASGVLLWGPPGCGKTLLAKAVAAESKANFISIKGPELLNKFVGESEAAVRKVFQRARSSVPCIIFFDELDALVPRRDDAGSEASARVVNTLLTELDGLSLRGGIHVIAATNRPDMIDDAMLRPGRFGAQIFVDLPGREERVDILRALARVRPVDFAPEIAEIARRATGFSGADIRMLLNEATKSAFKRESTRIELQDFVWAAPRVEASVSRDSTKYQELRKRFKR